MEEIQARNNTIKMDVCRHKDESFQIILNLDINKTITFYDSIRKSCRNFQLLKHISKGIWGRRQGDKFVMVGERITSLMPFKGLINFQFVNQQVYQRSSEEKMDEGGQARNPPQLAGQADGRGDDPKISR